MDGGPVVVGVDGSAVARNAARWAAREAMRRRVGLRIVYADAAAQPVPADSHRAKEHHLRDEVARWLAASTDAAREQEPGVPIDAAAVRGTAEKVLIAESEQAGLLVVGDRGFGGFTGLLAGAVAVKAAAHARCSVAVVPDTGEPLTFPVTGPVVAGVDDAQSSEQVLAHAFAVAASRAVPVHVVHAWEVVGIDLRWLRTRLPEEEVSENEQRFVAEALAGWAERYPDVEVRRFVGRGSPTGELLARAAEAQLVVVGARGRGGVAGAHLGSTSHKLIHHSPCPVLVVRDNPS
ncbi:universal stress protein [Saccharopolyspora elongata]|uniref:Universal stress protein n=1 Tax=Saccharopolyspora elongata TaxID=2530387 RepID=A0A4V2YJ55_9PSEU|nr:universal stress protein [Saccharopolyspora elongata]TDD37227.1 universal stress protein [Saccharopolyspora elongata]